MNTSQCNKNDSREKLDNMTQYQRLTDDRKPHTEKCIFTIFCYKSEFFNYVTKNAIYRGGTPHHNRFMALFLDHPGAPVPEEKFWTLWCKGRLIEADTLTIEVVQYKKYFLKLLLQSK